MKKWQNMKRSKVISSQLRQLLIMVKAISMNYILMLCIFLYPAKSLKFEYSSFGEAGSVNNITIVQQDSSWYDGTNPSFQDSAYWLTSDPEKVINNYNNSLGQVMYKDPVQFMPAHHTNSPKKFSSFNTSFTFQISTKSLYDWSGNGMAFFISNSRRAPRRSDDAFLGLTNTDNISTFFAVEFDTHLTSAFNDSSGSHIGIDINSLTSLNQTDTSPSSSSGFYPQLYLYNNYKFTAWIEYNSSNTLIQVWMTNWTSSPRPPQPCLQLFYDLSTVFQDSMSLYVGFSATNDVGQDVGMEGHALFSWNFSSVDPEPSQNPQRQESVVPKPSQNPQRQESVVPKPHVKQRAGTTWKVLVALAVIIGVLLAFAIALFCILKKRKNMSSSSNHDTITLGSHSKNSSIELAASTPCSSPRYSYKELRRSAHGFTDQNQVGEGGFSRVYRATLGDGSTVAIKKLKEGFRKEAEFISEIKIISSIRHRNLLQLRGWCYEKGEALLVYNYMSNGSLDSYLYGKKRGTLESEIRLRVLAGVASALEYMHTGLGECVLHRDVKAANVLLTEKFEPMLSDFGLARLIGHGGHAVTMTAVGTPGYVAPEVVYTGKATDKVDVYSFGILALEMASGRPVIYRSTTLQADEFRLLDWVWLLHQSNQLMEVLDLSMQIDMPPVQMERWRYVLHVALMCCYPAPEARPTMRQVSQALQGDTLLLMHPLPATRPLFPTMPDCQISAISGSSTSGIETSITGSTSHSHSHSHSHSEAGVFSNSTACQPSSTASPLAYARE